MALNQIVVLQKQAVRIINKAGNYETTNPLFIKSHVMKFNDLVYYEIMQIMIGAKSKSPPGYIQRFFSIQECKYDFRDVCKFNVQKAKKGI